MPLDGCEQNRGPAIRTCHRGRAPVRAQAAQLSTGEEGVGAEPTTLASIAGARPRAPTTLSPPAGLLATTCEVALTLGPPFFPPTFVLVELLSALAQSWTLLGSHLLMGLEEQGGPGDTSRRRRRSKPTANAAASPDHS
jgi:hypothetical protein